VSTFSGVITAMVTPFSEDGEVDLPAARRVARFLTENGSDGLVLAGTTGESPTLDDSEKLALVRAVREEVGPEAQLIAGTGSNDTRHSVELTRAATEAGADAALIVTPYYNKPNPAGIRAHFEACAAATDKPVIAYNIPSRCVVNVPPDELRDLAAAIPNLTGVKQANDDELGPIDGLEVLAGNDNVFARCLASGGTGGILVASHIVGPEMREIADAAAKGEHERAARLDAKLQPLYEALSVTTNPIPVKTALEMLGICSARMRLPMVPADDAQRDTVRAALEARGLAVVA
jgi:4-hydroxy-tetrahydrodipicolinate synthase